MSRPRIYTDEERKQRMREAVRKYRKNNRDKVNAQHKKYYEKNKDRYKEWKKTCREKEKEEKEQLRSEAESAYLDMEFAMIMAGQDWKFIVMGKETAEKIFEILKKIKE